MCALRTGKKPHKRLDNYKIDIFVFLRRL